MITDYLTDRSITVESQEIKLSGGVPQGSVLGPTLWNLQYNGVLELDLPEGCNTVAFADDLGLLVSADEETMLMEAAYLAFSAISE